MLPTTRHVVFTKEQRRRRGLFLVGSTCVLASCFACALLLSPLESSASDAASVRLGADAKYSAVPDRVPYSPVILDTEAGWRARREVAIAQSKRRASDVPTLGFEFFHESWDPTVRCAYEMRVGRDWVCDPLLSMARKNGSLAVHFGPADSYLFEYEMYALVPDVEIHTVHESSDAGPEFVRHHHKTKLSDVQNDALGRRTILATLDSIRRERVVDVVKINIVDAYAYYVILSAIRSGAFRHVNQLVIDVPIRTSTEWTKQKVHDVMSSLSSIGFDVFHKEIRASGGYTCTFSLVRVEW